VNIILAPDWESMVPDHLSQEYPDHLWQC